MISSLSFADTPCFSSNCQRHTSCRIWKIHSNSVDSGNTSYKVSLRLWTIISHEDIWVALTKKQLFAKRDFNNAKASVNVSICSSLVITIPIGDAPATEYVQKIKTRILCLSMFEDESTKISSDDCCIYNEIFIIRKVSFYIYWINERKHDISDIYHIKMPFFVGIGFQWFRKFYSHISPFCTLI